MAVNNTQSIVDGIIAGVDADITTKITVNSIDPVDVGNATSAWQGMVTLWEKINLEDTSQGTVAPTALTSQDGATYWQAVTNGFVYWRKESGAWVSKISLTYGFTVEDGVLSGLRTFINGSIVTVEKGTWSISNVQYSKATQTQFTVPVADANFTRYDLIYADNTSAIGYTSGVASTTPAYPSPGAGQIFVDYVVVPSVASGINPYLLSGGTNSASVIVQGTALSDGTYNASSDSVPLWPKYNAYDLASGYSIPVDYNSVTKIISGFASLQNFIINFNV